MITALLAAALIFFAVTAIELAMERPLHLERIRDANRARKEAEAGRKSAEQDALSLAIHNEEQQQLLRKLQARLSSMAPEVLSLGNIPDLDERVRRAHLN